MKIQLIPPRHQRYWKVPAVLNFFLGGAGAGFILLNIFFTALYDGFPGLQRAMGSNVLAILVVGLGMLTLMTEAGCPGNARFLFKGFRHSWISREIVFFLVLLCLGITDYLMPHPLFKLLTACSAAGLILSHGFIVFRSRAVFGWNMPVVPLYFMVSGVSHGYGIMLLTGIWRDTALDHLFSTAGLGLIAVNMVVWSIYLKKIANHHATDFLSGLYTPFSVLINTVSGNLIPMFLISLSLMLKFMAVYTVLLASLSVISGIFILTGGLYSKFCILMIAGAYRNVEI